MDKAEAARLLTIELATFRQRRYDDLATMADLPKHTIEVVGASGIRYYVNVVVHWDGEAGGNVRVIGTIDDGGVRAFVPMSDDFIKAPDGTFIGETA